MGEIFAIAFLLGLCCLSYLAHKNDISKKRKYEGEALNKLKLEIEKIPNSENEVAFYRNSGGIWIETSETDIRRIIRRTCRTSQRYGYIYHDGIFSISSDQIKKHVFVVERENDYDFGKNLYYSEWAKGNKKFNDRVKKAMGRS